MSGRGAQGGQPGTPVKAGRGDAKQQRKGPHRFVARAAKFDGRCTELKGHIFELKTMGQADNYMKTSEEIALYVGRTYKDGSDIKKAVEDLVIPNLVMPGNPPDDASRGVLLLWETRMKSYAKQLNNLENNVKALYSLVWGQCTDALQAQVEAEPNFAQAKDPQDGIELLKLIRDIAFNYQGQKYLPHAISEALFNFWEFKQGTLSTADYYDKFQNQLKVLEHVGANVSLHPGIVKAEVFDPEDPTDVELTRAKEKFLAATFILKSDRNRFQKLIDDLENSNSAGSSHNIYPATLVDAYHRLSTWKHSRSAYLPRGIQQSDGVVFNNVGETTTEVNEGTTLANVGNKSGNKKSGKPVQCFNCKEYGHYSSACPHEKMDTDGNGDNTSGKTDGTSLLVLAVEKEEAYV